MEDGDYELEIQAKDHLGNIFTSAPYRIEVKPPIYRTIYAKMLYFLLGMLGLGMVYKMQSNHYKKEAARMQELKESELAVEQQKMAQLKLQKEKQFAKLKEERTAAELNHLNNLLAASTMNLVVKNEFMESIKQELKSAIASGSQDDVKRSLKGIVREIDTTLRVQEDWEKFELHFDQVHGDFLVRLRDRFNDLSPNEQKLCAFLRLNLNTKDIANLMNISLRGVEVARYRLRRKLELRRGQNLSKFILDF